MDLHKIQRLALTLGLASVIALILMWLSDFNGGWIASILVSLVLSVSLQKLCRRHKKVSLTS